MGVRLGCRLATALCAAVLLGLTFSYASLLTSGRLSIAQSDFLAYFAASRLIVEGHGGQIYSFHPLAHTEALLILPVRLADGGLPYLYPPFFAVLTVPLIAVSLGAAFILWLILNCALLVGVLYALQRLSRLRAYAIPLLWTGCLSFLPLFMALAQGQVSILLLALLTACLLSLRSGRDGLAGVALALALLKPTYILPFLLLLLIWRRWRALAAFGATALCLVALPAPVLGPSVNASYLHILGQAAGYHGHFGFEVMRNQTLAGLAQLLAPRGSRLLTAALDGLALALLVRCALSPSGSPKPRVPSGCPAGSPKPASPAGYPASVDLPFALCVVVAILVNPHVFIHDLTMLLLPVAVALRYRRLAGGYLYVLLATGYLAILAGPRLMFTVPLQLSVLAMAALAVSLFVTAERARALRGDAEVELAAGYSGGEAGLGDPEGQPLGDLPSSATDRARSA